MTQLAGGDELEVTFSPEDGYGAHDPERVMEIKKEQLGFDPEIGSVVAAKLPDGIAAHPAGVLRC